MPIVVTPPLPSKGFTPPAPQGMSGFGTLPQLGYNWPALFRDADGIPLNMLSFEIIDFGAISYKEIFQNAKVILSTPVFSCALERLLGVDARIVDLPLNAAAEATVAMLQALYFWEPRVEVMDIQFTADVINGHLIATLQLKIRNVIYGTDTPYTQNAVFNVPTQVTQGLPPMNQPLLIPGPPGPQGIPGAPGATGQRGSIWMWGTGTPPDSLLVANYVNDKYLDIATGDVWSIEPASGGARKHWSKTGDAKRVG